jgi:mannose-6-phosphate isomerase
VADPAAGTAERLAQEVAALQAWLQEAAWPLWLAHGLDRERGGFFEALDLRAHRCAAPFRRLRVVARQIFVFSNAHRCGVAGAASAVQIGLDFLANHAAQHDGGYAWRFDLAHRPTDLRRDLYDHAFVLLALSSATAVVGTDVLRPKALALVDWLERDFVHPLGGYVESLPPALPRRQNPHMHLLEALLAAYEAFGDVLFLDRAAALVSLFAERLFDEASGALPEFFDEALAPARNAGVFLVEPGHHCEWVWLLHQARSLGVAHPQLDELMARLMVFVDRFAIDPVHGGVVDELSSDGALRSGGARLWPQTERLRAEFLRADGTVARRLAAVRGLAAYLRADGLWHERRLADGALSDEAAPASSLYHLTGAIVAVGKPAVLF